MKKEIELSCFNCFKKFFRTISNRRQDLRRGCKPFCSKKCASEHSNTSIKLRCKRCNKKIYKKFSEITSSKTKRFFCSHKCSAEVTLNSKTVEISTMYRETAFKYLEHKCCNCGYDIVEALEVHHKDRNRENNHISNLCIVCANCHTLIHKNKVFVPVI